jgi:hypothetical protein
MRPRQFGVVVPNRICGLRRDIRGVEGNLCRDAECFCRILAAKGRTATIVMQRQSGDEIKIYGY